MSFFNIGPEEIFVILILALIVLGPERMVIAARTLGRWVRSFRTWAADITAEFQAVTSELTSEFDELRTEMRGLQDELRGVQAEIAHETSQIGDALRVDTSLGGSGSGMIEGSYSGGITSQPVAGVVGLNGADSHDAAVVNGSKPVMASKEDPTTDVAFLDLDEMVVMPRSERPSAPNGHSLSANGHIAAEPVAEPVMVAATLPRRGRSAVAVYQRQRRRMGLVSGA